MTKIEQSLEMLVERSTIPPGAMQLPPGSFGQSVDRFEDTIRPATKMWTFGKWLAGIVAAIVVGTLAVDEFMDNNATKADLATHVEDDFEPVRVAVHAIGSGVTVLITERKREIKLAKLRRHIGKYKHSYEQQMADYRNAKARDRWMKKPIQDPAWIKLETDLEDLLEQEMTMPLTFVVAKKKE